jgi:peptide/nickel transport system permease protein
MARSLIRRPRIPLPRSGKVRLGLAVFAFFILVAIIGPWFVGNVMHTTVTAVDFNAIAAGPSWHHLLGTTVAGQDCLAQLIVGARGSVLVGIISGLLATFLSALVGVWSGFVGGMTDRVLNAFTNLVMTLPGFALLIIVSGYVANVSLLMIAFIIGVLEWPSGARYLRAQTMSMRGRDFTMALETVGERRWRIILVEVMPHLYGIISAMFLRAVVAGVFAEAALAFLGIGDAGGVSWGTMIGNAEAQNAMMHGLWGWLVPPGLCIAILGTATALVNFGLDELSNPALRTSNAKTVRAFNRQQERERARAGKEATA